MKVNEYAALDKNLIPNLSRTQRYQLEDKEKELRLRQQVGWATLDDLLDDVERSVDPDFKDVLDSGESIAEWKVPKDYQYGSIDMKKDERSINEPELSQNLEAAL